MDWSKIHQIYMIGIKGVGMTMLAQYLANNGKSISGSDVADTFMTDEVLKKIGAVVKTGFSEEQLDLTADLIIYSSAYNETNPELARAKASTVKTISYAEALADCFNQSYGIAVSGSHGKTTTTAWLGYLMQESGLSPNVLVGATVPQFGGTTITGKSNFLVIEADEYQNKFLLLNPKIVLLNNIDYDHPDFFPSANEYLQTFANFIKRLPKSGRLIANLDDSNIARLLKDYREPLTSYSLLETSQADLIAYHFEAQHGVQYFKVRFNGDEMGDFSIQLAGQHNISNALAVIATGLELGIELHIIRTHLANFTGTTRRLQKLGLYNQALIYDDYAHHPTEIKASIQAIKQLHPDKKITVLFHPHTFSRTKAFLNDFGQCFAGVDRLIILDIYGSVRETQGGINSEELMSEIKSNHNVTEILYLPKLEDAEAQLRQCLTDQDCLVLMGAGDVFRVGHNLIKHITHNTTH
jgi:UDP-N-acetylmuramate--alanine ligase